MTGMDLIADIGATNSRCALLDDDGIQHSSEVYTNASFASLEALLDDYLEPRVSSARPRRAALAIAAPVTGDGVSMVNIDWTFSRNALERHLGVDALVVVNDFAALARALPELGSADVHRIGPGEITPRAAKCVLGPGSGLGVAGIVPAADGWAVAGGEGGHMTLPVANDEEQAVVETVRRRHGHCSAELLLSGPGLVLLHATLAELDGRAPKRVLPQDVTARALEGEPVAARALEMFFSMLGTVASNLALIFAAHGGVYIGGGIVPRLVDAIERSGFRERFVDKGDYRGYLESIPTFVVTEPLPALRGLRALLKPGSAPQR